MSERLLLEVAGSGRPGAELPPSGTLVVGSDRQRAGLVLSGTGVADVHCAIGRAKGGGWVVKDLGSVAGTLVNGRRVDAARLAAGDELRVGDAVLRVTAPGAPAPAATAPAPLVATPAAAPAPAPGEPAPKPAALPSISGFRVEQRLGRGGMGDVYLAVQESLDRKVALKILAPRFAADAEFVRRFQAEARAAAALNHPNVVTVYDVGEDRGTHYLSMEYMERSTLEERVQKAGRLPVDEVLAILRDAAAGLVYAEAKRIVHRDLKPANLMQNHVGQTKIADLGLATHVEAEEAQTADRKVFGTPHFMSPEQARGEKVDHRSDLYSLGATAYRLLTGHTPFEGKDAREIVRALLKDEPRPMRELAPDLPAGVVELVESLMRKDAALRCPSAAEALRRIEALRSATRPAGAARARRSSLAPVLLLLLAAGGGAWWWYVGRELFAPPPAPAPVAGPGARGNGPAPDVDAVPEPPEPKPAPVVAAPPKPREKDDKELQLFEANAKVALLELLQRELPPEARRDELRMLAQRYQGTSAATEALEKADSIALMLDATAKADSARKGAVEELTRKVREAARLDARPPQPGTALLAMRAVVGQSELAQDPEFVRARKDIESSLIAITVHHAKETMGAANRLLERGDFEGAKALLADLLPAFDLPEFPIGQGPSGVDELFEIGRQARERFHNLEQVKDVYERKRAREDALAVAAGLEGPAGLERELATLDLGAARERLERLAGRLGAPEEQAWARELAAECAAGQAVLETLGREFAQWRRRGFTDPRDKKGAQHDAVGADAQGILYEAAPGRVERVPWAVWGGDVKELSKLFEKRLQREWTPEESAAIAALLRFAAAIEATRVVSKMFDAAKRANFTEGNARDLAEVFPQVELWAERGGQESKARLARETEAAALLSQALRAATEGRWASATAGLERLLDGHGDTLLVRLFSDGRTLEELSGG